MTGTLAGRTALVTGGSRGIGKAIVKSLVAAGAKVAFTYRTEREKAEALSHELDGRAIPFALEVTDRTQVRDVLHAVERKLGAPAILVNNAGINKPTDFDQVSDEDWDHILAVNLKAPFIVSQEALPYLARAGRGSIIMIGSVSGQYGGPRTAHYAASKAGLISLAQVIARFGSKQNIRCNTVAAGLIQSEMAAQGLASAAVQTASQNIVLGRLGMAEEVAAAVVFLASDAAAYITAQTINVNGGLYF
jgi:NAD(P)-dependent dehydrogenase (short-subunit alcohol dehydrogenase family)